MGSLELSSLPQDMTKEEKESLQDFILNGCPGLLRVQQSDIFNYFQLYMSGKTYAEIATIAKAPKDLVMYLSYKSNWLEHRFKHYENISLNILEKIKHVKLDSTNTLVTVIKAYGKYIEAKSNKYLSTNDASVIEGIDSKILSTYYKSLDSLEKILGGDPQDPENPKAPMVSINMGMGAAASIKQVDSKTLEITDETAGDLIKALASMKKETEKK